MRADEAPDCLSVFEDHQCGNGLDTELAGRITMSVDIHLGEFELPLVLSAQALVDRSDGAARTAPGGPEIDNYWGRGLKDLGREILIINVEQVGMCTHSFLSHFPMLAVSVFS